MTNTSKVLDEFSVCAYYVGRYQESLDAGKEVLRVANNAGLNRKTIKRVQQNLAYAKRKLHDQRVRETRREATKMAKQEAGAGAAAGFGVSEGRRRLVWDRGGAVAGAVATGKVVDVVEAERAAEAGGAEDDVRGEEDGEADTAPLKATAHAPAGATTTREGRVAWDSAWKAMPPFTNVSSLGDEQQGGVGGVARGRLAMSELGSEDDGEDVVGDVGNEGNEGNGGNEGDEGGRLHQLFIPS